MSDIHFTLWVSTMDGPFINTTMVNSSDIRCVPFIKEDTVSTKAIKATSYIVIMLFALLGNAAIIAIVAKNKHMRTTTNYLIANMAVSDMLLSAFAVPIINPKRRKFVIALIWLISMGLHGIYFYIARLQRLNGVHICSFSFEPAFDKQKSKMTGQHSTTYEHWGSILL